ncbi:MAG: hypothetical protein ABIK26_07735 [Candidatus Omnitrophota bacterium]
MKRPLFLSILILFFISPFAYATTTNFDWNRLPAEKDTKEYENKKYKTLEEYKQAYIEGKCSSVWVWIHMGQEEKIALVDNLKQRFRKIDNVIINEPAEFYIYQLDYVIANAPNSKNFRLKILFRTIAVMEYDFDEGIDKGITARKWLGSISPFFEMRQKNIDR